MRLIKRVDFDKEVRLVSAFITSDCQKLQKLTKRAILQALMQHKNIIFKIILVHTAAVYS